MGVVHKVKRAAAANERQMAANTPSPAASSSPSPSKYPRFGKRGAPQAFPSKLYEILEGENPDIVGWTATGRGFEVRDHARLSSEVLGRFFKQDKFSSFQRQLNLYGFRKITKGSEAGSYQHPHFRRGERTTLLTIRRSTKTSPARVVPSSPASRLLPPAVPLSSVAADKPRSATPSPPPAPVSRGVLPWPRPPATHEGLHSDVGGVSPDGNIGGGGLAVTADGRLGGTEPPADRRDDGRQQQQRHQHQHQPGAWAADARGGGRGDGGGGGGGGYVQSVGGHTAGAGGGWANADRAVHGGSGWKEVDVAANRSAVANNHSGGAHTGGDPQWGEQAAKRERERAQGLDHQDVEVVDLLQRMAKEAQDSPSRKQASASTRWEGGNAQGAPAAASHSEAHFRVPRMAAGSNDIQQNQQVFAGRLYDILNNERASNIPRVSFPSGFAGDERSPGFSRQQHVGLPAPYPTTTSSAEGSRAPCGNSFDSASAAHRGGGGADMSERDRQMLLARSRSVPGERGDAAYNHRHLHQHDGPTFESGANRPTGGRGVGSVGGSLFESRFGSGSTPSGSSLPRYVLDRQYNVRDQAGSADSGRRGSAEAEGYGRGSWHAPDRPYATSTSSAFSKYQGEEHGGAGAVPVAAVKTEQPWGHHRPFDGGR